MKADYEKYKHLIFNGTLPEGYKFFDFWAQGNDYYFVAAHAYRIQAMTKGPNVTINVITVITVLVNSFTRFSPLGNLLQCVIYMSFLHQFCRYRKDRILLLLKGFWSKFQIKSVIEPDPDE